MHVVLHALWSSRRLHCWAECPQRWRQRAATPSSNAGVVDHDFALPAQDLAEHLADVGGQPSQCTLNLPRDLLGPCPSDRLAVALARVERTDDPWLGAVRVPTVSLSASEAVKWLLAVRAGQHADDFELGHDLRFLAEVARFAVDRVADQRVLPSMRLDADGRLTASWRPWLHDEEGAECLAGLLMTMPPAARAVDDAIGPDAWPRLSDALGGMVDAIVRQRLIREDFMDALEDRTIDDPHVAWLHGLLGDASALPVTGEDAVRLFRDVRGWLVRLDELAGLAELRLRLDLEAPDSTDQPWMVQVGLVPRHDSDTLLPAADIWAETPEVVQAAGDSDSQEVLITELGAAARIWPALDQLLGEATPEAVSLSTAQAWLFLGEYRPLLEDAGVVIRVPEWWGDVESQLGLRLSLDALDDAPNGLETRVAYRWIVAVGEQRLTLDQLLNLQQSGERLVRVEDRWVEINPEQLAAAIELVKAEEDNEASLLEALRLAGGGDDCTAGMAVLGVEATGWLQGLLDAPEDAKLEQVQQPELFTGSLRPYQKTGLSWLSFLDRHGLGACLADDMGLGKTVQLIALLQWERQAGRLVGPTLLVVPTSVVGNWRRELERFAPELEVHIQHGPERPLGDALASIAADADVVITTYALVARDRESLEPIEWHRVVLDEAQSIKNPPTKQAGAIRALSSTRRVALTGTPVENRLTELWSIMDFCNPGFLGDQGEFRRRFARPIERHRDDSAAADLRRLVQPFILRRLKTDRTVIDDLPDCVETREHAVLTAEQATLYREAVEEMLGSVDQSEGIQRRGLILALLGKLKQICDHPVLAVKGEDAVTQAVSEGDPGTLARRSGKVVRMLELLEEVLANGERALVFTQYRRMGRLLASMIEHQLESRTLFLHGGTPVPKREKMIETFQNPEGDAPVFVLSLKAGGLGLNLTAANHVFHFDRWWNPAVEKQATDRAFRIGQTRTVHVHPFVCTGTLEERIDRMLEEKTELAERIIGTGEDWITEMSTGQLRDLLTLREDAFQEVEV
ncbi:MAG: DEAD/DEAH box helicase [Phycisphaerales bacterium]|nr:DEAD/DEAH box helicase [Phycisphaerales bacterium]